MAVSEYEALDRAHAERRYGKYSSGYEAGLKRGRRENDFGYAERQRLRGLLEEIVEFDQTSDALPDDLVLRVRRELWGE